MLYMASFCASEDAEYKFVCFHAFDFILHGLLDSQKSLQTIVAIQSDTLGVGTALAFHL